MEALAELGAAFVFGLLTPLGAVCVLPLYPAFLVYLASQLKGEHHGRLVILYFGLVIVAGVIVFMVLLGLLFTTILQASLTNVVGIVSPIAFGFLWLISWLLIFNVDVGRFLPRGRTRVLSNPWWSAFVYGFFFGAIVIPCNPLFIAALFTRAVTTTDFLFNLLQFLFFGLGIGFPLLVFAAISGAATDKVIGFITRYRRAINLIVGLIMLGISTYYLVFVFKIFAGFSAG